MWGSKISWFLVIIFVFYVLLMRKLNNIHTTDQVGDCLDHFATHLSNTTKRNRIRKCSCYQFGNRNKHFPSYWTLNVTVGKKYSASCFGENKEYREENIAQKIIKSFKSCSNDTEDTEGYQFDNYYLWKRSKCAQIN